MGHLVIAGPGRSGTSFLVRFLDECGLETRLHELHWHEAPRAGYERRLVGSDLPYVVKDPWLWTYCESVDPGLVDVLVVPLRRLEDVARSRLDQERRVVGNVEYHAETRGGAIYRLRPEEQMGIAAEGTYRLLRWAAEKRIRVMLLHFPSLVTDGRYLVEALSEFIAPVCPLERAVALHEELAD